MPTAQSSEPRLQGGPGMMTAPAYQVHLPAFEGPLDLLLQLIEREKLDISTISLAHVAEQFLAYVREMEEIEAEALADFLVVAAKLVWIKSRLLAPQPSAASAEEEEEDPGEALARQLREYKRFKEAAAALRGLEEAGRHTYPRVAPPPELARRLDSSSITLADLLAAAGTAFRALPPPASPDRIVTPFIVTIADQIALIRRATGGDRTITFRSLLQGARHRLEIIVTLLAVLELIKRGQLVATQDGLFGEIVIQPMAGVEITINGEPREA